MSRHLCYLKELPSDESTIKHTGVTWGRGEKKGQEYEGLRRKIRAGESDPRCSKHLFY